jgi:16S rRNA (adenine1518-N6/adenine1519-N6)-dimethyltransferase
MPDFLAPGDYFRQRKSYPRKWLGQHFLSQPSTALKIVQSAALRDADAVVEIGPGLGSLTRFILPLAKKLHLIELDKDMVEYLRAVIPSQKVVIHQQDALSFDFGNIAAIEGRRLVVLGNLPYNISSPLMFHLLESFPAVERAVFMVQKEVGARFAATPSTKDYGVLTVLLGIYSKVRTLFTVGPGQFYPSPKVDSVVLRIDFAEERPPGPDFDFLRKLVSKVFQQRRKTLGKNFSGMFGLSGTALKECFEQAAIDPKRRPETLSAEEFLVLAELVLRRGYFL